MQKQGGAGLCNPDLVQPRILEAAPAWFSTGLKQAQVADCKYLRGERAAVKGNTVVIPDGRRRLVACDSGSSAQAELVRTHRITTARCMNRFDPWLWSPGSRLTPEPGMTETDARPR